MALDARSARLYQAAGGGHGDYSGNEVEMLDLAADNPRWIQLMEPTFAVRDGPYYSDGKPTSRHNYFGSHVNEFDNRIMLFGGAQYSSGAILKTVDSFNLSTNTYSPAGTHPNFPSSVSSAEMKPMCTDPRNGDVYVFGGSSTGFSNPAVVAWRRATNSWSSAVSVPLLSGNFRSACACWDSSRNVIVLISGTAMRVYNPSTQTMTSATLSGASIPAQNDADFQGNSTVYVPALDAYLHYVGTSGGTVYSINASTRVASSLGTTGGASIPSNQHGSFGRFRYVPALHGVVYAPTYSGNVWFLRAH